MMEIFGLEDSWAVKSDEDVIAFMNTMWTCAQEDNIKYLLVSDDLWWRLRMYLQTLSQYSTELPSVVMLVWKELPVIRHEDPRP